MTSKAATFKALKTLPASVAILDPSGRIVAVNDTWKDFGRRNGLRLDRFAVGADYLRYCRSREPGMRHFNRNLRALLAGRLDLLTHVYPCHSPTRQRWFSLIGVPLSRNEPAGVALLHVNLTDMLPRPAAARRKADGAECAAAAIDLDAIGGAVEQSVSTQLSRQLATMVTGARPAARRRQRATRGEAERTGPTGARLSRRQAEVLHMLGEGKTNKEIAKAIARSPNTVKLHVSAILKRLKLKSRTQAALLSSGLNGQQFRA
jgi:DNA-binding CsgD family transcriptional regulator